MTTMIEMEDKNIGRGVHGMKDGEEKDDWYTMKDDEEKMKIEKKDERNSKELEEEDEKM